jgi:hypothetical protein
LLIQYICSNPPYLEAVFIYNLRIFHAMVTGMHLTWNQLYSHIIKDNIPIIWTSVNAYSYTRMFHLIRTAL